MVKFVSPGPTATHNWAASGTRLWPTLTEERSNQDEQLAGSTIKTYKVQFNELNPKNADRG